MGQLIHKVIFIVGMLSLLHTAYSAAEHKSKMRVIEQEYSSLPTDILLQGIVSLFVTMYGVLYSAGDFKEIRATMQLANKSWETVGNRPSFYSFCHRGRILNSHHLPKSKATYNNIENLDS